MSPLHAKIMNLLCEVPMDFRYTPTEKQAYKLGHRDARHAAAELVAAEQSKLPANVMRSVVGALDNAMPLMDARRYQVGVSVKLLTGDAKALRDHLASNLPAEQAFQPNRNELRRIITEMREAAKLYSGWADGCASDAIGWADGLERAMGGGE